MESNIDAKPPTLSINTFVEVLQTAFLFNPRNHPSPYAKSQWFQVNPKGKFNAQVTEYELGQLLPGPKYEFNLGVWYALLDSIASICAAQAFFSDIETGPISPPKYDLFGGTRRYQDYSILADKEALLYPDPPRFRAPLRQQLADQQIEIAVKFISLHEQAHVFAGHLLFVREAGSARLLEIDEADVSQHWGEARRSIELQADAIAFQTLFQSCAGNLDELRASEPRFFNIQSTVDWLTACLTATAVVCCLFEIADSVRTKEIHRRQHPTAKCRTLSLFQIFLTLLLPLVQTDDELHLALRRVLQNTAVIFQTLGVEPLEKEALNWLWRPSSATTDCGGVMELRQLQEVLQRLEPKLQQYQAQVQQRLRSRG